MSGSTVPAVLAAIYAKLQAALPAVQTVYGPPLQNMRADYVAFPYNDGNQAVVLTQSIEDMAGQSDLEVYDAIGQTVSWRGKPAEFTAAVQAVYANTDALQAAIAADRSLGLDAVQLSDFATGELSPLQTEKGPVAVLAWSIHVEAWRQ